MDKFDYRYIIINYNYRPNYVFHIHYARKTDRAAIRYKTILEKKTGWTVLEIEKSLYPAEDERGNDYYMGIWSKEK